jgi:luciferase family oxidoreductase group 1
MTLRLSILDQSIALTGRPQSASIRETLDLACHAERLGYHRFWVAEHHNHETIVGTAPEILMAAIAAQTRRIRIGSAGVMLPHYSAFKVCSMRWRQAGSTSASEGRRDLTGAQLSR